MKKALILFVFVILSVWAVARFVDFSSGLIFGEPDEFVHVELVKSWLEKKQPLYEGQPFYFEMPGYFVVAAFFSGLVFHDPLVSLRFVSFVAAILTSGLIYFYLSSRGPRRLALAGAIFYWLMPLGLFYSRTGLIEPFLVFNLTGAFVFYELGRRQKSLLAAAVAGIFLGWALLVKYSVLPLLAVMLFALVLDFTRENVGFWRRGYFRLNLLSALPPLVGLVIFLPVFLYYYGRDTFAVAWQTKQVLGLYGGVSQSLSWERLLEFPWWFSAPVVLLVLGGLARGLVRLRDDYLLLTVFFLFLLSDLYRQPFYPRYLVLLVPFLAILAARALTVFRRFGWVSLALLSVFLVNRTTLGEAWGAAHQNLMERAVTIAAESVEGNGWVFSNFWPNYFGRALGTEKFFWVSSGEDDYGSFGIKEKRDALEILKEEGGVVLLEDFYTRLYIAQPKARLESQQAIKDSSPPPVVFQSSNSNFPFSRKAGNRIELYVFAKP